MIAPMLRRTIPIHVAPPPLALHVEEPVITGEPEGLLDLVEQAVDAELGMSVPRGAWLRALHVKGGEAILSLAPELNCCLPSVTQAAFEVLRRTLPDTDIYVRPARH